MATDVMIKDGAVTANKIVANAITTDKLAANCITTDKMMIGDYNNLIQKNPDSNPEGIPVTTCLLYTSGRRKSSMRNTPCWKSRTTPKSRRLMNSSITRARCAIRPWRIS